MLIEENLLGAACNYEPRELSYFTDQGVPALTMSRRVDGAFPSAINPVAIWEVKEYYYTTTFGSRVADGVYETMLDGFEINLLSRRMRIRRPKHYLMVDDYFTWWNCGKSYLCRIIDMLHMGLVDEVLFGRQVVKRLPQIVKGWIDHEGLSEQ